MKEQICFRPDSDNDDEDSVIPERFQIKREIASISCRHVVKILDYKAAIGQFDDIRNESQIIDVVADYALLGSFCGITTERSGDASFGKKRGACFAHCGQARLEDALP